jgi:Flp pilus assembly protein TadG
VRLVRWLRRTGDHRALAALEFALVAPFLVTLVLSVYDVSNAAIAWIQLCGAARAIALIATASAATPSSTNVLSSTAAYTASTAIYALLPDLTTAATSQFGVTLSSIAFTPTVATCTSGCTYVGNVAWSVALQGSAATRPCGHPAAVADSAAPSLTTLPTDAFSAAPLLVVDITYNFTPVFNVLFGSGLVLRQSAYMGTRVGTNANWVQYTGPNQAKVQCPGYVT